jgi:hypothetical protein
MVGRPNFPANVNERDDLMGMARPTAGLNSLDQKREASMADEGGMSGAVMECENPQRAACQPTDHRPLADPSAVLDAASPRVRTWLAVSLVGLGAVSLGAYFVLRARAPWWSRWVG